MKRNRRAAWAAAGLLALLLLPAALHWFEARDPDGIHSLSDTIWYTLVTLTTVGYGDVIPATPGGKLIGAILALLSTILSAFLISLFLSLLLGRLLPLLRLLLRRGRPRFVFEQRNAGTEALAEALARQERCVTVFTDPAASHALTTEEVLRLRGGSLVFCMGENGMDNYRRACALVRRGARACCLSGYEPDALPEGLTVFNPYAGCARLYWERFPLRRPDESIVLIGSGPWAEALLDQALLVNVADPLQSVRYLVYGGFADYRRNRPYLRQLCAPDGAEAPGDALVFSDGPWNGDWQALRSADRIILCSGSENEVLSVFQSLRRLGVLSGAVHARLDQDLDGLTAFGSVRELADPELVLRTRLDRRAMALHRIYLEGAGTASPAWEELSAFLRRSNLAAADHLPVKLRVLLGADAAFSRDACAEAFRRWQAAEDRERYRRIEHLRWMRFHLLHNWQYAPRRDNAARLHPLLLPFDSLSPEDQVKDDYAWELLGALARNDSLW